MSTKIEIVNLCKSIAADIEGWKFVGGGFKDARMKHTDKLIDPLWSYSPGSVLTTPVAGVLHKEVEKIHKKIFGFSCYWTHRVSYKNYYQGYGRGGLRIVDIVENDAESCIRKILEQGFSLLDKTYNFSSEKGLLESIPEDIEGADGVKYCIIRAYLGDLDYVRRYRFDEIKTERPKKIEKIDQIIAHFELG